MSSKKQTNHVSHANSLGSQIDRYNTEVDKKIPIKHKLDTNSNIHKRGKDTRITNPVDDVRELEYQKYLAVQIGKANSKYVSPPSGGSEWSSHDKMIAFDHGILDTSSAALRAEQRAAATLPIREKYVRAIILYGAWGWDSRRELIEHLEAVSEIRSRLGFERPPSQSTIARKVNKLKKEDDWAAVKRAAIQGVHAVMQRGIPLPQTVADSHGLDIPPVIDETLVDEGTRREAIRNWVRLIFDTVLDEITFRRGQNSQYSVQQIVAVIAQAVLINGVESGPAMARWDYDNTEIPTAAHVSRLLAETDRSEIQIMFTDATIEFISLAQSLGFFGEEYNLACDPTWVTWWGANSDLVAKLIKNPSECASGQGWCFSTVAVTETDARFAIGIDIAENKKERVAQFRRLLRPLVPEDNIGRIHIDREFYSAKAIRMCRAMTGNNWVIRAKRPNEGKIQEVIDSTPPGSPNYQTNIGFGNLDIKPNLFVHPVPKTLQKEYQMGEHVSFLSDLSTDEYSTADIFNSYRSRWSIETTVRQLKHNFTPQSTSPNPNTRLFLFQISLLFYNMHVLINQAPSPKYALRLTVPYYEVLKAIVDVTFTRVAKK